MASEHEEAQIWLDEGTETVAELADLVDGLVSSSGQLEKVNINKWKGGISPPTGAQWDPPQSINQFLPQACVLRRGQQFNWPLETTTETVAAC